MTAEEARELVAYSDWATARIFEAAEKLSAAELTAPAPSSFPTVLATLVHLVSTEWIWMRRLLGESPAQPPAWAASARLAELRQELSRVEQERRAFLQGLSDDDLRRPLAYRTLNGAAHEDPLAIVLRHIVNHATYHRGQVSTQLRQLGHAPPGTDLIAFAWTR
jgi:uncharacterized damage-inducible protein DinB